MSRVQAVKAAGKGIQGVTFFKKVFTCYTIYEYIVITWCMSSIFMNYYTYLVLPLPIYKAYEFYGQYGKGTIVMSFIICIQIISIHISLNVQ